MSDDPQETPKVEAVVATGIVRGIAKYHWGPMSGAKVTLGDRSATSDSAGRYEISALPPGVYTVAAEPAFPGYDAPTQKVEVAAGETKNVDIYFDFKKTIVEGHIYDLSGKPIKDAALSGVLSGYEMGTATTDEQGYFRLEGVTPGDRFIRVNAQGYMVETRDFAAKEGETTTLEFRLAPATFKIHGVITDRNEGKPIAKAEVRLCKRESGTVLQNVTSDDTGYYEFAVVPGIYKIKTTAGGHEVEEWDGSVSADAKVDLRVKRVKENPYGEHDVLFRSNEKGEWTEEED